MVKMHASYELTWQLSVFLFICVRVRDIDRDGNSHFSFVFLNFEKCLKTWNPII